MNLKQISKRLLPEIARDTLWAYRKYNFQIAKRTFKDFLEQPSREKNYLKLNTNLPADHLIFPPNIELKITPEIRGIYELYAYREMRNVVEMQGFIKYAKNRHSFIDIGALYGDFSLIFCAMTNGTAYAVDPSPDANDVLSKLMALNPDKQIFQHPIAIGKENGKFEMAFEWIHCVDLAGAADQENTITVEQKTMDAFVNSIGEEPDTIKIDAEGAELDILFGGKNYFNNTAPRIFLEIHPTYLARRGQSVEELVNLLTEYGYAIFHSDGVPAKNPAKLFSEHEGFLVHRVICEHKTNLKNGRLIP